jgi:hypothetical protein
MDEIALSSSEDIVMEAVVSEEERMAHVPDTYGTLRRGVVFVAARV